MKVGTAYVSIRARLDKLEKDLADAKGLTTKRANETAKAVNNVFKGVIAYFGIAQVTSFGKSIFEVGKEIARLEKSFKEITGSSIAANKEFDFLRKTSGDLGQNFYDLADSYKGILAASKDTVLQGKATRDVFVGITKAGATLGLTSDSIAGALNAVQQMMSKGKVQAEELRGQLGERLPGAFNLAAEAMGVTTIELNKLLDDGKVLAEDLLPKLGRLLSDRYSGSVDDATRASNKLAEAWKDAKKIISDAGFLDIVTESMSGLAAAMSDKTFQENLKNTSILIADLVRGIKDLIGMILYIPKAINKAMHNLPGGFGIQDFLKSWTEARKALQDFWNEVDKLIEGEDQTGKRFKINVPINLNQVIAQEFKQIDLESAKLYADLLKDDASAAKKAKKEIEELERQIDALNDAIAESNENPWDPIGYDIDKGGIDEVAAAIQKLEIERNNRAIATARRIAVQQCVEDTYDIDKGDPFAGLVDYAEDAANEMQDAFAGWGNTLSSELADAVLDSEFAFDAIARSFEKMLLQMVLQKKLIEPLFNEIFATGIMSHASGGAYKSSSLSNYEGMVTNKPHLFTFASGGVFGEAGWEGILPLKQMSSGKLGVEASGAGSGVIINIINNAGVQVSQREKQTPQGPQIDVILDSITAGNAMRRGSSTNRALRNIYGAREQLVTR